MLFWRLFKYDLLRGFQYNRFWYLVEVIMVSFITLFNGLWLKRAYPDVMFGWVDVLCLLLKGEKPIRELEIFRFPAMWMFIFALFVFLLLAYPGDGFSLHGIQVYLRSEKSGRWWLSKCLWMLVNTVLMWGLLWLTSYLVSCWMGMGEIGSLSTELRLQILGLEENVQIFWLLMLLFVVPVVMTFSLGLLTLTLAVFVNAITAYLLVVSYLFFGVLFAFSGFVGNYVMLLRYRALAESLDGFVLKGLMIGALLAVCSAGIGYRQLGKRFFVRGDR